MAHTGVFHDRLEGLSPNISIFPGYYCAARISPNVDSCETLSRADTPQTGTLISRPRAVLGLHVPRLRLHQTFP